MDSTDRRPRAPGAARPDRPDRRGELARFLRSRRARITPADVGLPPGPRRRTPGLRREEVAQLAGVGITWYTWLEQGRPINASPQVLDAVCRTLRMDAAERAHLYRLAGVPVPAACGTDPDATLPPEVAGILRALDPLPACVYDARMDLHDWNEGYLALFPGVALLDPGRPDRRRNIVWRSFVTPSCCHSYGEREPELRHLAASLRGAYGRHVGEPHWEEFLVELRLASAEFAEMWERQDVAEGAAHVKRVRHPAEGVIPVTATSMDIRGVPEKRLVVYSPEDEAAEGCLRRARAMEDPIIGCPLHARRLSEILAARVS
ncbi:transcriptional regulator [Mangrovactinospora gilvigrisea]|uniref:Transcriptional regulator n=1 Tax=Mangrovactinospora gilvigrisea TaxID=1428644 RepID=A0A1J7BW78_9ACTN|nr:helix-turn-helix transcriptional regulator [Mangrovactinospora gilvigrisea]OIV37721.1 transcriptional regulator [Mangrovactinospora gilvigrisea]